MSYLCGSSTCMKWLHDATDVALHGCDEGDIIIINLTTGTPYTSTSTSTSTSKSASKPTSTSPSKSTATLTTSTSTSASTAQDDDMPELEHVDIEIEDLTCPTLLPMKQHVDRATQTEIIKVDVQVQTNYNMEFKVHLTTYHITSHRTASHRVASIPSHPIHRISSHLICVQPLTSSNIGMKQPSASPSATAMKSKCAIPFKQRKTPAHTHAHVHVHDKENSASLANM